jgi:hypothetical protein
VIEVDLDALGARIAATREQAKATDPKALQARVRELEAEIGTVGKHDPAQSAAFEAERRRLVERIDALLETIRRYEGVMEEARRRLAEAESAVGGVWGLMDSALSGAAVAVDSPPPVAPSERVVRPAGAPSRNADGLISAYQRDLLTAMAQRHPAPSTRAQVATLARKSIKSSAFGPNLRALMDAGYVMLTGDRLAITSTGFDALGGYEAPPTGGALIDWWLGKLDNAERVFLRALIDAYPRWVTREEIAAATGRSLTSSAFNPTLRDLVDRDLAEESDRTYRAADVFFEGGTR